MAEAREALGAERALERTHEIHSGGKLSLGTASQRARALSASVTPTCESEIRNQSWESLRDYSGSKLEKSLK